MTYPLEIRPEDFTEDRFGVLVKEIEGRLQDTYPGRFNTSHFFRQWREMMQLGIARAWESPGAMIGVTFHPNLFTGDFNAHVVFWWSTPEGRGHRETRGLLQVAESAARQHNCRLVCSAAYGEMSGERMKNFYKRKGFVEAESIFRKEL